MDPFHKRKEEEEPSRSLGRYSSRRHAVKPRPRTFFTPTITLPVHAPDPSPTPQRHTPPRHGTDPGRPSPQPRAAPRR
jgi:hypothetical protein